MINIIMMYHKCDIENCDFKCKNKGDLKKT